MVKNSWITRNDDIIRLIMHDNVNYI